MPAIVISQYDIICVFFLMLAWLAHLKNKKVGFYLCFAVAITLKLFALFVFVPLVLLKEKRVLYIIGELIKGCSLWIVCKLFFYQDMAYKIATGSFMEDMLQKFSVVTLGSVSLVSASLFSIIYFGVCIIAYTKKITEKEEFNKWFIYLSFVVFGSFSLFALINPYWALLYVPFSIILLFMHPNKFKINLFLEMFMSIGLQICLVHTFSWVYSKGVLEFNTYFSRWITNKNSRYGSVKDLLEITGATAFLPIIAGMTVACFVGMIVINIPNKNNENDTLKIERSVVWLRFMFALLIPALMLFVYLVPEKICIINTSGEGVAISENYYNICQAEAEQEICFDSDAILDSIEIDVTVSESPFLRNASLMVELLDDDTGEVIASDRIPYNKIVKQNKICASLKEIMVHKDKAYRIKLFSLNAEEKGYVAPLITEGKVIDNDMMINGVPLNSTVSMRIYIQ